MRERERLEDFRGGLVACRGCHRLVNFVPGEFLPVTCCGYLYSPEGGPVDLVIYDRLAPEDLLYVQRMPAETIPVDAEPQEPDPEPEPEGVPDPDPEDDEDAPSDAEVADLVASAAQIADRRPGRLQALRQRGPRYD